MKIWLKVLCLLMFLGFIYMVHPYIEKAIANQTGHYTQVKASHILVDSQKEAADLRIRIDNGENFGLLAKKYSKCPSGQNGGDLGYFSRGQMVPEFENAAFNLPIGAVSEPIHTNFGWHLIKVYNKI